MKIYAGSFNTRLSGVVERNIERNITHPKYDYNGPVYWDIAVFLMDKVL